ncbi:hypothetical protein BDV29DRAFT_170837 [Aspergillus leporis]|uniref:Isopropylmalate dehydrogenase-like domain-containing protein n=1 Tax=Aspergillus leporis TaxID=41062 RepID=A0A5N5XA62_9EURO|nr:hypothetical protein BDV29DRAFT_170837 [Aspergillus leporis]
MTIKTLRLGLAIGHGTGRELTAVFERVIQKLASRYSLQIEFTRSARIYHSYHTLTTSGSDKDLIEYISDETTEDAEDYRRFCETILANGIHVIFRTAIHAQSLYLVRDLLQAVKVEHFKIGNANALLFVRDEAQGFYAGTNKYDSNQHSLTRTSTFSRATFDRILEFTLDRAREEWGADNVPKTVTLAYKFHLFDGVFQTWADHWKSQFEIDVDFVQPDTLNRSLMVSGVQGRRIIVAGNEYADIIQPVLLKWFGNSTPETMYAENVYLHAELNRLSEYQTVHGSADAIAGQGLVNPFATIRAAAAIIERHGGTDAVGVQRLTERTIRSLLQRNLTTKDQGGSCSTDAVVEHFLQAIDCSCDEIVLKAPLVDQHATPDKTDPWMGKRSALVVVDYQNDFIASIPSPAMAELSKTLPQLIQCARNQGRDVVFVRFLGNPNYQGASWKYRNIVLGKPEKCIEGTWGAELGAGVTPEPGEKVFDKKALFDPFLLPEFSSYVDEQKFEHVVLVGLYSDVCVDTTARTAFQKGLFTTIVEDCTMSLHSKQEPHLRYMEEVYGTRVLGLADFLK